MAGKKGSNGSGAKGLESTKMKWGDSQMKRSYANVCNVTSTREEVVMLFGMNQAWNRGQKEVTIGLTDRIVISPYAAKRLAMLLSGVVTQYESRFGALNADIPPARDKTKVEQALQETAALIQAEAQLGVHRVVIHPWISARPCC